MKSVCADAFEEVEPVDGALKALNAVAGTFDDEEA